MTADRRPESDPLADELRTLGGDIVVPAPDAEVVAQDVLQRLAEEPAPVVPRQPARVAAALRRRWRSVVTAVCGVLLVVALTTPVRATVTGWLEFGGVLVKPGPAVSTAPLPPPAKSRISLDHAARRVGFDPLVPKQLGSPSGVEVTTDPRLVSLSWAQDGEDIRLDEFHATLPPVFIKRVGDEAAYVNLGRGRVLALWFPQPHKLVLRDNDGRESTTSARPAGATLVWVVDGVTLRLEGVDNRTKATRIAESTLGTR